jgi:hypothetical protein
MNRAANGSDDRTAGSRGRFAVLVMVGFAVVAAAFAWWWNVGRSQRTLALYGPETATLIRVARTVEIFVPPGASERAAPDSVETRPATTRQIDISHAAGLLNARASLLDDASFDWHSKPTSASTGDHVLIRFVEKNNQVMIRIDFDSRQLSIVPDGGQATLVKKTAEGWRSFVARCAKDEHAPAPLAD